MKNRNPLLEKTFALALTSIEIYKTLRLKNEFTLSGQFLKSSTAPGALAEEAQSAHSNRDFIAKLEIGLKELRESKYWLRLLMTSRYIESDDPVAIQLTGLQSECEALFTSILKKSKLKN